MDSTGAYAKLGEEEQRWLAERELRGAHRNTVTVEGAAGGGVQAGDRSDIAGTTSAWEEDGEFLRRADLALAEIAAARGRLDAGTYGRCEICSVEIDPERLEALPATRVCIRHAH